jgi:hypothetical protein
MAAVASVSPPEATARFMAVASPLASPRTCRTLATVARASSVGPASFGCQFPWATRRRGWRVAEWSADYRTRSSASRSPAATTASTGCCSMAQAAISATTQALMMASGAPCEVRESRMVSSRRCAAAATGVTRRTAAPAWLRRCCCRRWHTGRPTRQQRIVHGVLLSAVLAGQVGWVVQAVRPCRVE